MVTLTITFGLDAMVDSAKDKLIAPKISKLTAPLVPDLSPLRKDLIATFILNDLQWVVSNRNRQLLFNIIRKAEDAREEYCLAAESVKNHVRPTMWRNLNHYFDALRRFEQCLSHLYEATSCMNRLHQPFDGLRQFDPGDRSILERVQIMHNSIKHMDERFDMGPFAKETSFSFFAAKDEATGGDKDFDTAGSVPMWLTNEGLECARARISYAELAQEIRDFSREAEKLATLEPQKPKGSP